MSGKIEDLIARLKEYESQRTDESSSVVEVDPILFTQTLIPDISVQQVDKAYLDRLASEGEESSINDDYDPRRWGNAKKPLRWYTIR